jgi:hypothetical protein
MWSEELISIPIACRANERMSPVTKVIVSRFGLINACASPFARRMILASSMYMLAAKRTGASKRKSC